MQPTIESVMYRRPKFLEELLEIREQMSRDAFYDVDLFAEHVRSGQHNTANGEKKVPTSKRTAVKDKVQRK